MKSFYAINQTGTDLYKIGMTEKGHPTDRVTQLQTGNPFPLRLCWFVEVNRYPGPKLFEDYFKKKLVDFKVMREWFSLTPNQVHDLRVTAAWMADPNIQEHNARLGICACGKQLNHKEKINDSV